MTGQSLRSILASTGPVLLDFDGPVTRLLPPGINAELASAAREPLCEAGYELPADLMASSDHIAILRFSAGVDPRTRAGVEEVCRNLEVMATEHSEPTIGADDFLMACSATARPVIVVSNNDADAIQSYLDRHQLRDLIADIVGRPRGHPELMKPHPHLLQSAMRLLSASPSEVVMVGDTVGDVEASHAAGVRIIGFAKNERRGTELADAGADAITPTMAELADLLLSHS